MTKPPHWEPSKQHDRTPAADDVDTIRRRLKEIKTEEGRDEPVGGATGAVGGMWGEDGA